MFCLAIMFSEHILEKHSATLTGAEKQLIHTDAGSLKISFWFPDTSTRQQWQFTYSALVVSNWSNLWIFTGGRKDMEGRGDANVRTCKGWEGGKPCGWGQEGRAWEEDPDVHVIFLIVNSCGSPGTELLKWNGSLLWMLKKRKKKLCENDGRRVWVSNKSF